MVTWRTFMSVKVGAVLDRCWYVPARTRTDDLVVTVVGVLVGEVVVVVVVVVDWTRGRSWSVDRT
jgi:hypothetical protein